MRKFYFILFFFIPFQINAQVYIGARHTAMANASAALTGLDAIGGNPAGISSLNRPSFSLSAEKEWWSVPLQAHAALVVPSALAHIGLLGGTYQAGSDYRAIQMAGVLSRRLGNRFSLGVRLQYQHQFFLPLDESVAGISADVGVQYELRPDWMWGFELVNPLALNIPGTGPLQGLRLGTRYSFSSQTLIALQVAYATGGEADLAVGLEYELLSWLRLRGGVSVNPFLHYSGAGLAFKRLTIDGAVRVHPQLGMSPQIRLAYAL